MTNLLDNVGGGNSVRQVDPDTDTAALQRLPRFIRDFLLYEMPSSADMSYMEKYIQRYGSKQIYALLVNMRDLMAEKTYGKDYPKLGLFKVHRIKPRQTGRGG